MEIKKEDLEMYQDVDGKFFWALPKSFFKKEEIIIEVINEPEPVPVPLTPEELAAITKAEKKAKLEAELAALEE